MASLPFRRSFPWLTALILLVSLAILSVAIDLIVAPTGYNAFIRVNDGTNTARMILLPRYMAQGTTWAFFANGIGGTIDAFLNLMFVLWMRKKPRFQKIASALIVFVCVVSVARSIAAATYGWVADISPQLILTEQDRVNPSDRRTNFTIYGWSSQLIKFALDEQDRSSLSDLMTLVLTMRGLSVGLAVLDSVALVFASLRLHVIRRANVRHHTAKV